MQKLNIQEVPNNFIEVPVFADEYIFGGNSKIQGDVLRADGDWRSRLAFENQYNNGVESMSCTVYGTLSAIEILLTEKFDFSTDYSERFTSTLAGTTKSGNSPHKVGETIRGRGLVSETQLPFSMEITRWEEYFAPIPSQLSREGQKWLKQWSFGHDWVITRDTRKEEKIELLTDALKFSPVGVSVYGWADEKGVYVKAGNDNHWCLLVAGDKDYWYVLDSYAPYLKRLAKNYDFGFAKRYSIERRKSNCLETLLEKFK